MPIPLALTFCCRYAYRVSKQEVTATGERLAKAREVARLSQRDLALAIGVSPATVALYEKGMRVPPGPILVAMAQALGVSAESLVDVNIEPAASAQ